jgi:signal peptidase
MNPTLWTGDIVITRDVPPEQVELDDIIRFDYNGVSVVHRVVEIRQTGQGLVFITRGDNNNVDDSPIGVDQYRGKSVLVIPKIGLIGVGVRLIYQGIRGI